LNGLAPDYLIELMSYQHMNSVTIDPYRYVALEQQHKLGSMHVSRQYSSGRDNVPVLC